MKIERMTKEDIPFMLSIRNECAEMLHNNRIFTIKEGIKWFEDFNPEYYVITKDGEKVGYFRTSNLDIENKSIYIGADIHKDYRGKGLAKEAYQMFIPYITEKYQLEKILLEVLSTNKVAINLYKKLGFVIVNIDKKAMKRNGVDINNIKMVLGVKK